MREKLIYAAAAGLIILAVTFVLRGHDKAGSPQLPSISDESSTKTRRNDRISTETDRPSSTHTSGDAEASTGNSTLKSVSTSHTASHATKNRTANPSPQQPTFKSPSQSTRSHNNAGADAPTDTVETAEDAPVENRPLPAVRLAQDVQLPAVILSIHKEQNDPNNQKPKPIKDAMKAIVDTFYEDLAKAAEQGEHIAIEPDGTHVIGKGPAVDNARDRANEVYRALFGDADYNAMTMEAVLEAQLPPTE